MSYGPGSVRRSSALLPVTIDTILFSLLLMATMLSPLLMVLFKLVLEPDRN